ncbi:MAG: hypothetical protein AB4041_20345 [Microcystaceae cyanobacterium]
MKTSKRQELPSSNRYKMAGLKRFTNFMFWGPPLIMGSVLFIVWQYQQNPAWLSGVQGEGQTLPQSQQLEEPGIYDELTPEGSSSTFNDSGNSGNLPFIQSPQQPINPSVDTTTNLNPFPQSNNSGNSSGQNNTNTKLPNIFPPLFPINKNNNTNRKPSSYTRSAPPIEIKVNSESELQKAIKQRASQSSSPQNNLSTTRQSTPNQAPPTSTNSNNPNNSITPQNIPNYQTPYTSQPSIPQYTYSPLPSSTYNNPTQSGGLNYGQTYNTPSYNNNNNNNNRQNLGNTNSVPTINGRPAPQFQPSIQGDRREYD